MRVLCEYYANKEQSHWTPGQMRIPPIVLKPGDPGTTHHPPPLARTVSPNPHTPHPCNSLTLTDQLTLHSHALCLSLGPLRRAQQRPPAAALTQLPVPALPRASCLASALWAALCVSGARPALELGGGHPLRTGYPIQRDTPVHDGRVGSAA
jgi:hypothetical protein